MHPRLTTDRTLASLAGFVRSMVPRRQSSPETTYDAGVQHVAHVLHVLQCVSALCTQLVPGKQFCTPERDAGLHYDKLFGPSPALDTVASAATQSPNFWKTLSPGAYWPLYVRVVLWRASRESDVPKALHTAAVTLHHRALAPLAWQCARALAKTSDIPSQLLREHLAAIAGRPLNSRMEDLTPDMPQLAAATPADVHNIAARTAHVPAAEVHHAQWYGGSHANLHPEARTLFVRTMDRIKSQFGDVVAQTLNNASALAGSAGEVELLGVPDPTTIGAVQDALSCLVGMREEVAVEHLNEDEDDEPDDDDDENLFASGPV